MAKYVLRPEPILPEVPLAYALLWVGSGYYPDAFIDKESQWNNPADTLMDPECSVTREWWEERIKKSPLNENGLTYTHALSMFSHIPSNDILTLDKLIDIATYKLFTYFSEKKIKFYGVKPIYHSIKKEYINAIKNIDPDDLAKNWKDQIKSFEYEEIDPKNVTYNDFYWNEEILKTFDKEYINIIVSTDDLFNTYPLSFSRSEKVQFAANNYFIDDKDNDEIQISETRGRKSKLPPEKIVKIALYSFVYRSENPDASQSSIIYGCMSWAKKTEGIDVPYETMRGWLSKILPKRDNEK